MKEQSHFAADTSAALEVIPACDALGAEIRGVDLSRPLDDGTVAALKDAWARHLVLLFRGQELSAGQQLSSARSFGPLSPPNPTSRNLEDYPEILVVSNVGPDGQPSDAGLGNAEAFWHADMTYLDEPPAGCCLFSREIPAAGGNTCFANMYLAYETLPAELKEAIEGRRAVHDASRNSAGRLRPGFEAQEDPRKTPGPHHPMVRTHPVTGRKALFLGRRPYAYVVGLSLEESETLLDRLWEHCHRAELAWCHQWRVGDLVLWDNRCTMHRRDPFDMSRRRVLHRTQIAGDRPY
jgi:taurine dioxygenase